jgi:hypothetical protein
LDAEISPIAAAPKELPVGRAYLDGELCGVRSDGTTSFSIIQAASDSGNADALVFFLFDLLFLDGEDLTGFPLSDRKTRLAAAMNKPVAALQYSDHQVGRGPTFYAEACKLGLEPGDFLKVDCAGCSHTAMLGPAYLNRLGLSHGTKSSISKIACDVEPAVRKVVPPYRSSGQISRLIPSYCRNGTSRCMATGRSATLVEMPIPVNACDNAL